MFSQINHWTFLTLKSLNGFCLKNMIKQLTKMLLKSIPETWPKFLKLNLHVLRSEILKKYLRMKKPWLILSLGNSKKKEIKILTLLIKNCIFKLVNFQRNPILEFLRRFDVMWCDVMAVLKLKSSLTLQVSNKNALHTNWKFIQSFFSKKYFKMSHFIETQSLTFLIEFPKKVFECFSLLVFISLIF